MKKNMSNNSKKYGILMTSMALLATIIGAPMSAQAECSHGNWGKAKHGEFFQKRMESLHTELKLTDTQEAAWKIFTEKSKPNAQPQKLDRSELSKLPTPERLDRMLAMMQTRQQNMQSHVQAVKSFYSILSAEQQKIFDEKFSHDLGNHDKH